MAKMLEPTWELGPYIDNYKGYIKVKRLLQIADTIDGLRTEALQLALGVLRDETLDGSTYEKIVKMLSENGDKQVDAQWATETTRHAQAVEQKLEGELKAYKNNLIKESIRLGQQDLANHQARMGNFDEAIKSHIKNLEVCTTTGQIFATNLKIVELAIISGKWSSVKTYLAKLDAAGASAEDQSKKWIADALCRLSQNDFEGAFHSLKHSSGKWDEILSLGDTAVMLVILGIASESRSTLKTQFDTVIPVRIMEADSQAQDLLDNFFRCRYAEVFQLLELRRGDMAANLFLAPHIDKLYRLIMERSLLQFAKVFKVVPLARMSKEFGMPVDMLEEALCDLMARGILQDARIDAVQGLLLIEPNGKPSLAIEQALATGKAHAAQYAQALVHLTITRAGLEVQAPRNAEMAGSRSMEMAIEPVELGSEPDSPMED